MKVGCVYILLRLLMGLACFPASGQYLSNPSFEGEPGLSVSPPSWEPFDVHSTPDTEPIGCDTFEASHGTTYMTLISRGPDHIQPNTQENAITHLQQPLESGKYYELLIDLASRSDVGHFSWDKGFIPYTSPVKLEVYGSDTGTDRGEFLSETEVISNQRWETFSLILSPQSTTNDLILEVAAIDNPGGMGNMILDMAHIVELDEPPIHFGALKIPNVFTPNGDGINDALVIPGLAPDSYLAIFDRVGKEVFRSHKYNHDWMGTDLNGTDLPNGTYWYILFPSNQEEAVKGFIYLKREQ